MFPLQSVFFPGENVPLHIFEDRYKQLIQDCRNEALAFGIPTYINQTIGYGVEMKLKEVIKTHDSGAMDIICVAQRIFKIESFNTNAPGKLYAGGTVSFLKNIADSTTALKTEVLRQIHQFYNLMELPYQKIVHEQFTSYTLVHKIGLSVQQEYKLLQMTSEHDRMLFIRDHLLKTIAVLKEVQKTKKVIEMNGHFRNFDPLDFEDYKL